MLAAREREKAQKALVQKQLAEAKSASSSRAASPMGNLARGGKKATPAKKAGSSVKVNIDQRQLDLSGLNLLDNEPSRVEEAPTMNFALDKLLEEVRKNIQLKGQEELSLVVIGKQCISRGIRCRNEDVIRTRRRGEIDINGTTFV